jgi:hypothetical protein
MTETARGRLGVTELFQISVLAIALLGSIAYTTAAFVRVAQGVPAHAPVRVTIPGIGAAERLPSVP